MSERSREVSNGPVEKISKYNVSQIRREVFNGVAKEMGIATARYDVCESWRESLVLFHFTHEVGQIRRKFCAINFH